MTLLKKSYAIIPGDFQRGGEVAVEVRGLLKTMGFDPASIRRAAICAYESEMNVVLHGGNGSFDLLIEPNRIVMDVKDDGPGIEDIEKAMQEGYSTALQIHREMGFGAGMGLPNIKRLSDACEIHSKKGQGTHLKICIDVKKNDGRSFQSQINTTIL